MILHTGLRTDIPAFYSEWFLRRLKEGYVLVRNPYQHEQVTRYTLHPDVVDLIGFCTKDPHPMLPHLDALQDYGQYWYVTITPYGRDIEPRVPPVDAVIAAFHALSQQLGAHRVGWRYDPILLHGEWTLERHIAAFARIAEALEGATTTCVISFIDLYAKVRRNFPGICEVPRESRLRLGEAMVDIARRHGMTLRPCAEGNELAAFGADCSGCMTIPLYEAALGCRLKIPRPVNSRGQQCACHLTCDIGAYNSCAHLCRYCYANESPAAVRTVMAQHDPASPFLIGHAEANDRIHQAQQRSWKDHQLSMADLCVFP